MDVAVSELLSNYLWKLVTELLKKVSSCTFFDLKNENISPIEYLTRCRQPQSNATDFIRRFLSSCWLGLMNLGMVGTDPSLA